MGVLADIEIRRLSVEGWLDATGKRRHLITPFADREKRSGVISYGLSSYGYDLRVGEDFQIFTGFYPGDGPKQLSTVDCIDPKSFSRGLCHPMAAWADGEDRVVLIPPHSFALGVSVERFDIPRDILAMCTGKSTYARSGMYLNFTPLEPEWSGYLTLEILNSTSKLLKVYANEGIGQLMFFRAEQVCSTSYQDKKGLYQNQKSAVTFPRVEK